MADGAMDFNEVKGLVEGVNTAFETYKQKNDERLKELESKGSEDVVTKEEIARIDAELNKKQEALDKFAAAMKRKAATKVDADGNEIDLDKKAREWAIAHTGMHRKDAEDFGAERLDEYKSAFASFLRKGADDALLTPDEKKALSVGIDPDGGYTVHPDMSGRAVGFIYETSPIRQYAASQTISTDALEGLYDLDEAGAGWVSETGSRSATSTPQVEKWRIPVHELYANPQATQKLLDDSAMDMEGWLSRKVADKFARMENAAFVTGDGVGKPRGFATYADWTTAGTYEHGKIEQFDTGVNGDFAAAPAGGDALIDALYGLKAGYRANAVWAMNRATTTMTRKLKDSDGAYLWQPGIAAGQPATLLGYPVAAFEDMASGTTTGALAIAVADWREAYTIVDRQGIRILRDPYTNKPYVGFYSVKRVGGDVSNFDAIKLVKFSA